MATRTLSTKIVLEGEAEYRRAVTGINDALKTMKSEMALVDSQFKGNANSMEALQVKGDVLQRQYTAQKEKLDALSTVLEKATRLKTQYGYQVEQTSGKLERAKAKLEELKSSTGDTTVQEEKLTAEIKKHEAALAAAQTGQEKATKAANSYQRQVNDTQRGLNDLDGELTRNGQYLDEARNSTDRCAKSIDEFGREVREAGDDSEDFGDASVDAVNALASVLAAAGVAAAIKEIADALMECVESARQFEKGMAEAFTMMPTATDAFKNKMSADMVEFSDRMNVLTDEAVPALYQALSAGVPKETVFDFMETAQKAAVGGVTDLKTSVDGLTSIVNAYGTDVISVQEVADDLFTTVRLGKTNFEELSQSIYNVIPIAASSGVMLSDVAAALAAITARGTPTAVATTQLRQVIAELTKDGTKAYEMFVKLAGVSFMQFIAQGNNLQDALQLMEQRAKDTGVGINSLFRSIEAGQAAISLTGTATDRFTNFLDQMADSAGAVDAAYSTMADTADYQSQRMAVALDNLKAAIGDTLVPTISDLNSVGANFLTWARGVVEENPWMIQALVALLAAATALAAGVAVLTLATTLAAAAMAALSTAAGLIVGPALLVVAALTGIATAAGLAGASVSQEERDLAALNQRLSETKTAHEEAQAAIETERVNTSNLITAVDQLASVEGRTAAQKAALLGLVDELNAAVPGLSLAYDEQTDSINLTTEAIQEMAAAQLEQEEREEAVSNLNQLYKTKIELEEAAEEAAAKLTLAQQSQNEGLDGLQAGTLEYTKAVMKNNASVEQAEKQVEGIAAAQADNKAQIGELEGKYNDLTSATDKVGVAMGEVAGYALVSAEELGVMKAATEEQRKATGSLVSQLDTLAGAFAEQEENGSLSVSTMLSLIDAGYAAALSIDAETGSARLNAEAFMALASAKLDEQMASVSDSVRENRAKAIEQEGLAAAAASSFMLDLASSYQAVASAANGEAEAAEANFMALQKLKENLGKVPTGNWSSKPSSGGGKSSGSKKKEKTGAELELEAYQEAVKELDHLRAMDEINEAEYYDRKKALGDQHLTTCEEHVDARRKLDEELHTYQAGEYERAVAALDQELQNEEITYEEHAQGLNELQRKYLTQGTDEWKENQRQQEADRVSAYEEQLTTLDTALEDGKITLAEHLEGLKNLQKQSLTEGTDLWRENQKKQEADIKSAYDEEVDDLKYFRDMEIITEEEYYRRLAGLRDQYLTENSDAWRSANVELHNYMEEQRKEELEALKAALDDKLDAIKDAYDGEIETIKDALSQEKEALKEGYTTSKDALKEKYTADKAAAKEAYEEKKAAIQKELDLEKERLNGILDGIDAEIQARRELREDEDQDGAIAAAQKRLDAAKAQLSFARTDEDKKQWEDEVVRLEKALSEAQKKKEDTAFYREKEQEKDKVKEELDAAQQAAKEKQDAASKDYDTVVSKLETEYNAKLKSMEADYNANLKRIEAEYAARLAAAEANYKAAVERAKQDYESSKASGGGGGGVYKDDRYNQQEWSDEVRDIARENNVDLGVAQDMYNANQNNKGNPDLPHYSNGRDTSDTASRAFSGAMAAAATGLMGAARAVQSVTKNATANVTINQASSLTSGQVDALVGKAVERLGR